MKISKIKLRQIIKEELAEAEETALNSPSEAGRQWKAQEEIYAALVNYAADKMRQSFEFGHDVATVEGKVKDDVLRLVSAALEEAAQIEL